MTTQMRASDDDRNEVVTRLNAAVGRGLLTLAEAEERITAAYAARHLSELATLTEDLPDPNPPATTRPNWPRPYRPGPNPRVFVAVALAVTLITVAAVSHMFLFPLIPLLFVLARFGRWRRPIRM